MGSLLQLLVRLLLLVALALVVFGATYLPPARGKIPAIVAGIAGGFMNTLAGVAGPAITVYAQASKWDQQRFAATLQPIFVISGLVPFIVKIVAGAGTITQISAWIWILGIAGMFLGISLGARASRMVSRTSRTKARFAPSYRWRGIRCCSRINGDPRKGAPRQKQSWGTLVLL
ncbi:sulfite exporter TauE/SafE family protein [Corynebacterium diphtheriae]|uniref:sulfite exporter TauE/SafE family protein n=1 Tax=Corynebacterium diphtheriae TaxID=1717 RepID=UPI00307A5FA2